VQIVYDASDLHIKFYELLVWNFSEEANDLLSGS
jgi:hypothetical protein